MAKRACGLVVFRRMNSQIQYLLLQASNGIHHWTPPKGHVDPGEDDLTTALRETEEEAGLNSSQLNVLPGFQEQLSYMAWGKPKMSVYFLAELSDPEAPVVISDEHQNWSWDKLEEACKMVDFPEMQRVLRKANDFLSKKNGT